MNLIVGPRCPILHQFSHKARVDIKNGRLKAIEAALRLSRCLVHNVMLEVGFYFQLLTTAFSCLALDYTLPQSSSTPLQMMWVPTPSPLSMEIHPTLKIIINAFFGSDLCGTLVPCHKVHIQCTHPNIIYFTLRACHCL